jgi:hypothetical protein
MLEVQHALNVITNVKPAALEINVSNVLQTEYKLVRNVNVEINILMMVKNVVNVIILVSNVMVLKKTNVLKNVQRVELMKMVNVKYYQVTTMFLDKVKLQNVITPVKLVKLVNSHQFL